MDHSLQNLAATSVARMSAGSVPIISGVKVRGKKKPKEHVEWCVPEICCDGASARITSPGVVDGDIDRPYSARPALKESFNVTLIRMVATHRNGFAIAPIRQQCPQLFPVGNSSFGWLRPKRL